MFKIPTMEDADILRQYLQYNTNYGCEYSLANNILWAEYYNTGFDIIEDNLIFGALSEAGDLPASVSFPVGGNDLKKTLDTVFEMYRKAGKQPVISSVSEVNFNKIQEWYPNEFEITYERDKADYIYTSERLAFLAGKKMHAKRNHINRFVEMFPDYVYEKIDDDNYMECARYAHKWAVKNALMDEGKLYEETIIKKALFNREKLGLKGALIRLGGEVVAFTLGEYLTEHVFVVHFEKAEADIQGAYAIINRDFVRNELTDYKYINREEDLGIEGLRKAKLSYRPDIILEKGTVRRKKLSF